MRRRASWPVLPLLWLATALRFYHLGVQSFWNDEGNSARLAERSIALIVEGAAGDVHPPLYYLMLAAWRQLLGDGEFALRAPSAFAGVLLVAGVFALGRLFHRRGATQRGERRGRRDSVAKASTASFHSLGALGAKLHFRDNIATLAALFAAVHPALIYYCQEARMYALLGLWAVLSTLLLVRLLPLLGQSRTRALYLWASGYLLVAVAGLYTHYFFPAILLIHNIVMALSFVRLRLMASDLQNRSTVSSHLNTTTPLHRYIRHWFALMLAAFLLYLPWLPIFLRQTGGRTADPIPAVSFLTNAARWLVLGETAPSGASWLPVAAFFLLALLGLFTSEPAENTEDEYKASPVSSPQSPISNLQSPRPSLTGPSRLSPVPSLQSLVSSLHIFLPPLLILLLGATRPAYYKFMIVVPPFVALLAARGAWFGWWLARRGGTAARWVLRGALLLPVLFVLWGSLQSLSHLYFDPAFARADYRGIAARIAAEAHRDAGIILNAANQWEVFTYYHRDGAPVYPLPRGQPDAQRIAAELEELAAKHDRLYALFWGEDERDPQRLVERWLDAHAFKAREEWVGDVRFVTYAVPPRPAVEMAVPSGATFGQHITLSGYTLELPSGDAATPGDILPLTLFWQTAQPLDTRYKVFLHLLDEEGQLAAQRDAEPVGNLAPTSTWQPGETVVDNHGLLLPVGLPPGRYMLRLGLYPLDDPAARLLVSWSGDEQREPGSGDSYPLAQITVR